VAADATRTTCCAPVGGVALVGGAPRVCRRKHCMGMAVALVVCALACVLHGGPPYAAGVRIQTEVKVARAVDVAVAMAAEE
jgi:hypothetical protein